MITKLDFSKDNLPAYRVEGKLTSADYDQVIPELERIVTETGKLTVYIELVNFGGWDDLEALIKELKFDAAHGRALERCAIVGEGRLQEWATEASGLFFSGEIRFFRHGEEAQARAFLGLS